MNLGFLISDFGFENAHGLSALKLHAQPETRSEIAGNTLECGGRARHERRHHLGDALANDDACASHPKPYPKAVWRYRFPPHSKLPCVLTDVPLNFECHAEMSATCEQWKRRANKSEIRNQKSEIAP